MSNTAERNAAVLKVQKSFRGYKVREYIANEAHYRLLDAVVAIQRAFRNWKIYINSFINTTTKKINKIRVNKDESKDAYWQRIKIGQASHEDKIHLWKLVIELRRQNLYASSDMCLHALHAADGSLSKAQAYLGSQSFITDHETKLLSLEKKQFFMPEIFPQKETKKKGSKAVNQLYASIHTAQEKASPVYLGLVKSYFYRRPRFRNPTPSYLRVGSRTGTRGSARAHLLTSASLAVLPSSATHRGDVIFEGSVETDTSEKFPSPMPEDKKEDSMLEDVSVVEENGLVLNEEGVNESEDEEMEEADEPSQELQYTVHDLCGERGEGQQGEDEEFLLMQPHNDIQ